MKCNSNSLIARDIVANCIDPIVAGLEANAVIVNRDDIDFSKVTFDAERKNVIDNIVLKPGKRGYKVYIPGDKPFSGTKTSLEKGANRNTFGNDLGIVILDNDPDVVGQIIEPMANGSFVVFYENKFKNLQKETTPGDSSFQIMGYYQGAKAESMENDKYSEDVDGGWSVLLKETKSPRAGLFLYKTSYAATKAIFDSLTAEPAVIE